MELTKDQRSALEALKKHPWYSVLELIERDAENNLGKLLLTCDLSKPENIELIKQNQTYMKARKDFFANIDRHIQDIYTPIIHS